MTHSVTYCCVGGRGAGRKKAENGGPLPPPFSTPALCLYFYLYKTKEKNQRKRKKKKKKSGECFPPRPGYRPPRVLPRPPGGSPALGGGGGQSSASRAAAFGPAAL